MKKVTRIVPLAALAHLLGLASLHAQTTLTGDHTITGDLTVEGAGGTTIDHDLQVNGSQFWLGTWTTPDPDVNALVIQTDSVLNPAEITFSALPSEAKFIWEKNGNATAVQLMQLSENGVLTLYNPANSDTIVIDTTNGGSLTIGGSEVVTQSSSGIINIDGVNELALGSATIPAVSFASDGDTGIYSPGADSIAIATGGVERLTIDSSGNATFGSEVEVASSTSVTAPAVITNFKVEDNGVIWAGEGADFDSTYQIPTGDGDRLMWIPAKSAIRFGGHELLTNVWDYTSIGYYSVSWGVDNQSSANYSTTWGYHNIASNAGATAWGRYGEATGSYATSWGRHTDAYGNYSTAWGNFTDALGAHATSWGHYTLAESAYSTALGQYNVGGVDSANNGDTIWLDLDPVLEVGIGDDNLNRSNAVTILKNGQTTLENKYWDSANPNTVPSDPDLGTPADESSAGQALVVKGHAEFEGNIILQDGTVINDADDLQAAVLVSSGGANLITSDSANRVAIGDDHTVVGTDGMAWGSNNTASATLSTAWGQETSASDHSSTAWGRLSDASGYAATAWGEETTASGNSSTAWGRLNDASGYIATAWGQSTTASGSQATAWGQVTIASGQRSTAWGQVTRAEAYASTALGAYNIGGFDSTNAGDTTWVELDPLFEIGNGISGDRTNAVTVLKNGQTILENKHWDDQLPTDVPTDPNASSGQALVVKGHTEFEGNVAIGPNADGSRPLMVEASGTNKPAARFSANSGTSHVIEINTTKVGGGQADIMFMQEGVQRASILHRINQFEIWTHTDGGPTGWKRNLEVNETGKVTFDGRVDDAANADTLEAVHVKKGYIFSSAGLKTTNGSVDTKDLTLTGSITLADGTVISSDDDLQTVILNPGTGNSVITQDSTSNADWGTNNTTTLATSSTLWGDSNTTENSYSTSWGINNTAKGLHSTAWGQGSKATSTNSTAWGYFNEASGSNATAWGMWTLAESALSTAIGRFNVGGVDGSNSGWGQWVELDPLFEIGFGTSVVDRANAVTVLKNGQTTLENKHWNSADPTAIPADPDGVIAGDQSSAGQALVVNGHAEVGGNLTVNGSVTIAHIPAQGGLDMGIYDGVP